MIAFHLELAQLWRCPVEWCAVWKGSVCACLEHLTEKHGGLTFFALKNVAKFFPPCTVTRSVWLNALRPDVSGVAVDALLFHEAGRRLVHRYRVYKDPFPHPALRDGVVPRLLSCVCRGHGHRPAHSPEDLHSGVGGASWSSACGLFSGGALMCSSRTNAACRSPTRSPCWGMRSWSVFAGTGVAATDLAGGGGGNQRSAGGGVDRAGTLCPGYQSAASSGILAVLVAGRR